LIKYGFTEDLWFHVDKFSSAHVYLRLKEGETMDDISEGVLEDCCQLVKANSIEGNKANNISVVYTPWSNLKKNWKYGYWPSRISQRKVGQKSKGGKTKK